MAAVTPTEDPRLRMLNLCIHTLYTLASNAHEEDDFKHALRRLRKVVQSVVTGGSNNWWKKTINEALEVTDDDKKAQKSARERRSSQDDKSVFQERRAKRVARLADAFRDDWALGVFQVTPPTNVPAVAREITNRVFIVHGHDMAMLAEVETFVRRIGLDAIILSGKPNEGRTLIEKFENHAVKASAAIVLLSPDDEVREADGTTNRRARQNVILELGYFTGVLGRALVVPLYKTGVELPSDYHGIVYVAFEGNWMVALAKELRAAKLPVNLANLADPS